MDNGYRYVWFEMLSRIHRVPTGQWPTWWYGVPITAAAGVGILAASHSGQLVLLAALLATWVVAFSSQWRVAVMALVITLPFAGLPELVLGVTGWPVLIKDLLFVGPAYLGFALRLARGNRLSGQFPPSLLAALLVFVAIVLVQAVHSSFTSPLVALLGLKTNLWYVPLAILASSLFTSIEEATRFVRIVICVSVIPASSVVLGGILVYSGHAAQLYNLYGPLASSVTQNFYATQIGSLNILRIPGIFAFFAQSFGFVVAMFPLAASVWLADQDRRWRVVGFGVTVLVGLSGLLAGSRSSWVWLPFQVVLIFAIVGRNRPAIAVASVLSAVALFIFLGPMLSSLLSFISALSWHYLVDFAGGELSAVIQAGSVFPGHGVGTQTGAVRYILPQGSTFGIGIEGWYAKTLYELGALGLIAVLGTWFLILGKMWSARSQILSQPGRAYAGALLIIVVTTILNLLKGPYIDLDPLNVYFWFFMGLAISLPRLAANAQAVQIGPLDELSSPTTAKVRIRAGQSSVS